MNDKISINPTTDPMMPDSVVPTIQNIMSSVNLRCKLDLQTIAMREFNVEHYPRRFGMLVMRLRQPRTTALVYSTGKLVCLGAKSEGDSITAARRFARKIQRLGFPVKFCDYKIVNILGSCDVKFCIQLENLVRTHHKCSYYEPELFPCSTYRMEHPNTVVQIFVNGKVVVMGAKTLQDMYEAFNKIFPILKKFRKNS